MLLPELFSVAGLAAVERVADAAELSEGFFGRIGEAAFGDGGCFVATQAADYLDAALVIGASPGCVGQDDACTGRKLGY
jgi:hypothetical protein